MLNGKGGIDWEQVPNGGYVLDSSGNAIKDVYIPYKGEILDRFGPSDGRYTSPTIDGKPFTYDQRSVPYIKDMSKYHQYGLPSPVNMLEDLGVLSEEIFK